MHTAARSTPVHRGRAAVSPGERRVPLFSPACVPGLFNYELALSGSGSSYPDSVASARIFSRSRPRRARIS